MTRPINVRPRTADFQAMQTAPRDMMIAAKDREEINRQAARWLDELGAEVTHFSVDGIVFEWHLGEIGTEPGDWIVWNVDDQTFRILPDNGFAAAFEDVPAEIELVVGDDEDDAADIDTNPVEEVVVDANQQKPNPNILKVKSQPEDPALT